MSSTSHDVDLYASQCSKRNWSVDIYVHHGAKMETDPYIRTIFIYLCMHINVFAQENAKEAWISIRVLVSWCLHPVLSAVSSLPLLKQSSAMSGSASSHAFESVHSSLRLRTVSIYTWIRSMYSTIRSINIGDYCVLCFGLLAYWLVGLLASWLVGLLACCSASLLACRHLGFLACCLLGLLALPVS